MSSSYNQLFIPQMREEVTSQPKGQDPDKVLESLYKSPEYLSRREELRKKDEENLKIQRERSKREAQKKREEAKRRTQEVVKRMREEERRRILMEKILKKTILTLIHLSFFLLGMIAGLTIQGWML